MKIQLWSLGKSHDTYVREGIELYTTRLNRYFPVEWQILGSPKQAGSMDENAIRKAEAGRILDLLEKDDYLVALDEGGREFDSTGLAGLIQSRANQGVKRMIFLIGGAYGLDASVLKKSSLVWSLSLLTFPHQLVRIILAEQLYRACTINRNESYHHRGPDRKQF